jgi:glycerophosphoryl diester phosphodiesterase
MKIISHRGNLTGAKSETENSLDAINKALNAGFDVEIDVWFQNNTWYLGHDKPIYSIEEKFLENPKFWCHAKNFDALDFMLKNKNIHCFWHQNDDFTLTSKNYIWTYPNKCIKDNSVLVIKKIPHLVFIPDCFGVCTDEPIFYNSIINEI